MAASNIDTKSRRLIVVLATVLLLAGILLASGVRTATAAQYPTIQECVDLLNQTRGAVSLRALGVQVADVTFTDDTAAVQALRDACKKRNDIVSLIVRESLSSAGCCQ